MGRPWDVVRGLLQPEAPGNPHLQLPGGHLAIQNNFILMVGSGADPCLSTAALQDGSYQPGRAYHTTHEDRFDLAGARAAWGIEGLWGSRQDQAREIILQELFSDVGQTNVDWDLTSGNASEAFMFKRQEVEPDERPALWRTNGAWEVTSDRETPSMGMIHMARYGPLPPIWDLLDKPSNETPSLPELGGIHLMPSRSSASCAWPATSRSRPRRRT